MKKKPNWFLRILTFLFIIYVALYIAGTTGYYEKTLRDKTILTEEKIKEFEEDISNNKPIDIESYLPEQTDYSNFLTKSANAIASSLGDLFENRTADFWQLIKSWFIG